MGMFCGLAGRLAGESMMKGRKGMMRVRKRAMKRKKMAKSNDTEQPSGSKDTRTIPSAVKLQQILGTSPPCRMLTPYEIELLRKSKREMDQVVGEVLARKRDTYDLTKRIDRYNI